MYIIYDKNTGEIKYSIKTNKKILNFLNWGLNYIKIDKDIPLSNLKIDLKTKELIKDIKKPILKKKKKKKQITPKEVDKWFDDNVTIDNQLDFIKKIFLSLDDRIKNTIINKRFNKTKL